MSLQEGDWLYNKVANRHVQTYVKGFVDVSGGDVILRNGNLNVGGRSDLSGDTVMHQNANVRGLIKQSDTIIEGGFIYKEVIDPSIQDTIDEINTIKDSLNQFIFVDVVDPSLIYIGGAANTISIRGDASMDNTLSVGDTVNMDSTLLVQGDVSMNSGLLVGGNVSMDSTLLVQGDVSMNSDFSVDGAVSMDSTLLVQGDVSMNSDFSVDGAVSMDSTLLVQGDVSMNSDFSVDGAVSMDSTLLVQGDVSMNSDLSVDGVVSMDSTLLVQGDVSMNSDFSVDGAVSIDSTLLVQGDASINTGLSVGGNVIMNNAVSIIGDASMNDKLFVVGDASMNSNLSVGGNVIMNNAVTIVGDVSMSSELSIDGIVNMNNGLIVNGDVSMNNGLSVGGDISMNNGLSVEGDVSMNSSLFVQGDVSMNNHLFVEGDISVNGVINVMTINSYDGAVIDGSLNCVDIVANRISAAYVDADNLIFESTDVSVNFIRTNELAVGGIPGAGRTLTVYDPSQSYIQLVDSSSSGSARGLELSFENGNSYLTNREAGPMYLETNGTTRMTITSSGNVGIGTDNPQQKLQVDGNIYLGPNNTNKFIHSGGDIGVSSDTHVRIVSDANSTSGTPGGDIIFGAGSDVNMDSNQDTDFPSSYPRNELMRIKGGGDVHISQGRFHSQHFREFRFSHYNSSANQARFYWLAAYPRTPNDEATSLSMDYAMSYGKGSSQHARGFFISGRLECHIKDYGDHGGGSDPGPVVDVKNARPRSAHLSSEEPRFYVFVNHSIRYGFLGVCVRNTRGDACTFGFSGTLTYAGRSSGLKTFNGDVYKNTGQYTSYGHAWSTCYPSSTTDEWTSIPSIASSNSVGKYEADSETSYFTGHHATYIDDLPNLNGEVNDGLIVCANKNDYYSPKNIESRGVENIEISESLPVTTLASKPYDKSCFGVIAPNTESNYNMKRLSIVNSVGEGAMWVSNKNGSLESGDYITTSSIPGYGQKQDSEFLANYSVAKITMDCDFKQTKKPTVMVQYDSSNNIIYDDEDQIVWGENTDTSGNVITDIPYNIRHVDPSGNIITEEEYNSKIAASEEAYIAAFVGCTYHCG